MKHSDFDDCEPLRCYDGAEELEEQDGEQKKYCLTMWGCLYAVLMDYGIDVSNIPGRVGKHIVDDFMEIMCKSGYIEENPEGDGEDD